MECVCGPSEPYQQNNSSRPWQMRGPDSHSQRGARSHALFERMLMEHHHIFSLDKNEIGCTDTAEHIIELMDDEPFKERFWWIAQPLLEEVRENLQDMLDAGAIRPLEITLV